MQHGEGGKPHLGLKYGMEADGCCSPGYSSGTRAATCSMVRWFKVAYEVGQTVQGGCTVWGRSAGGGERSVGETVGSGEW